MPPNQADFLTLLRTMDANAPRAERHLWLYWLITWIRGDKSSPAYAAERVGLFVDTVLTHPEAVVKWRAWWRVFLDETDATPLLADLGFAPRATFLSEISHRLRLKLLPITPETRNLAVLFQLFEPRPFDVQWLQAIEPQTLRRLETLLEFDGGNTQPGSFSPRQAVLLDALTYCVGQVNAAGYASEIRTRMSEDAQHLRPFHDLPLSLERFRYAISTPSQSLEECEQAATLLRTQLDSCRHAAYTVYGHLQEQGISVEIVFRLRQMRKRIIRCKHLIDSLMADGSVQATVNLVTHLAQESYETRSLKALFTTSGHMLAEKVAERSAESGEHYITRDAGEYRQMLRAAVGGGAVIGLTTWGKFAIYSLALSPFWDGLTAGLNYALSFVLIMLMHWTVATKQPAFTAPAMAAKLKSIDHEEELDGFVDEVVNLFRSQVASILGNLAAVIPVVLLLSWLLDLWGHRRMIDEARALHVLHDMTLLGPTVLFAAFTGVLLFISSIVAGWIENWFVLNQLDSAIRYHPKLRHFLGNRLAAATGQYLLHNVSGLTANISLGLMLGLIPAVAHFFGLGLEVRHVTLSAGQIAAAVFTLGSSVLDKSEFWWAVAGLAVVGPLNLGVSFYCAFRVAIMARGVTGLDRKRIHAAIFARVRKHPATFLLPPKA
ncbi:MAG: Site-specific recombinase [Proteobacteria bacterium]|nr:Site-specific recombinase [Pseudomonadota bacterium]